MTLSHCPHCGGVLPPGTARRTPAPQPLTPRQHQVQRFLEDFIDREGVAPTFQQIADAVGLRSVSSISEQLYQLQLKGWIRRDRMKRHSIELLHRFGETAGSPQEDRR